METEAALVGWHFASVMSDGSQPLPRPDLPEWTTVKAAFDEWLVSEPDDDDDDLPSEQMDVMVAYGWKE